MGRGDGETPGPQARVTLGFTGGCSAPLGPGSVCFQSVLETQLKQPQSPSEHE